MSFVVCDIQKLPFKHHCFNVIFMKDTIHHIDNPLQALTEIVRCCKSLTVVIEANRYNPIIFLRSGAHRYDHFSFEQFRQIILSNFKDVIFMKRENHFIFPELKFLFKIAVSIENLIEKIPFFGPFLTYNIAIVHIQKKEEAHLYNRRMIQDFLYNKMV